MEAFVVPPYFEQRGIGFGNVATSNYTYYVTIESKFSFLVKRNLNADYRKYPTTALLPIEQINTKGAYTLATQWLAALSMDVAGLERDCQLTVTPWAQERKPDCFVPIYWVVWRKGEQTVASVELFFPTREVRQLQVSQAEYIMRPPLKLEGN